MTSNEILVALGYIGVSILYILISLLVGAYFTVNRLLQMAPK